MKQLVFKRINELIQVDIVIFNYFYDLMLRFFLCHNIFIETAEEGKKRQKDPQKLDVTICSRSHRLHTSREGIDYFLFTSLFSGVKLFSSHSAILLQRGKGHLDKFLLNGLCDQDFSELFLFSSM